MQQENQTCFFIQKRRVYRIIQVALDSIVVGVSSVLTASLISLSSHNIIIER
jgi:hypothetical protein